MLASPDDPPTVEHTFDGQARVVKASRPDDEVKAVL